MRAVLLNEGGGIRDRSSFIKRSFGVKILCVRYALVSLKIKRFLGSGITRL